MPPTGFHFFNHQKAREDRGGGGGGSYDSDVQQKYKQVLRERGKSCRDIRGCAVWYDAFVAMVLLLYPWSCGNRGLNYRYSSTHYKRFLLFVYGYGYSTTIVICVHQYCHPTTVIHTLKLLPYDVFMVHSGCSDGFQHTSTSNRVQHYFFTPITLSSRDAQQPFWIPVLMCSTSNQWPALAVSSGNDGAHFGKSRPEPSLSIIMDNNGYSRAFVAIVEHTI